jgi:hypothetical protein
VKTIKKLAHYKAKVVPLGGYLLILSENPHHHPPKNKPFSQEMHLKIPLLSRGWMLSSSKSGCRE